MLAFTAGIFGASMGVGPIRTWAAMHRAHHQYTDDPEKDPHSIKRGFYWAHCGWLLKKPKTTVFYRDFVEHEFPSKIDKTASQLDESTSLISSPPSEINLEFEESDSESAQINAERAQRALGTLQWILWQERWYVFFFILTTIVIPISVCVLFCQDSWVNGLIYPGILRMFICQQSMFSTESICHFRSLQVTIPSQPFNDKNSSVNCANPLVTLLSYGQASQNYHHEFPHDYRVSSSVWAFDPTKWFIFVLSQLRLVDDLAKAPQSLVVQLQIQQQQHVLNHLKSQLNWGTPISKLPMIATKDFRKLCSSESSNNRIYIVIQNIIHDITPFMDQHPGGLALLKASHGKDATKAFYGGVYGHSTAAVNLLATMRIGVLDVGNDEDVWRRVAREESQNGDEDSRRNYRGATVEDLDIRPAISVNPSTPLKRAFEVAFENEFTFLPVIHEKNKRLLGVVRLSEQKPVDTTSASKEPLTIEYMHWFSQKAKERYAKEDVKDSTTTPLNSKILRPRSSGGKNYRVLTPLTPLEELGKFFNSGNYFAIITNGEGNLVYGVVTPEDLGKYEHSRPRL
ncbi:hypothetical protein JCM33374_g3888 [Metschnikowia sp. JCM 33374]|nr:hypothetical protein JCM33374_g3888 [Metschnikowia sp. JCM 33374]